MRREDRQQTTVCCVWLNDDLLVQPPSGNTVQQSELKMYIYKEPAMGALQISEISIKAAKWGETNIIYFLLCTYRFLPDWFVLFSRKAATVITGSVFHNYQTHRVQQLNPGWSSGDRFLQRCSKSVSDFPMFGQQEFHIVHFIVLWPGISQEQYKSKLG